MPFTDLREFIAVLEKMGEIVHVKNEVDTQYEMGAICRKVLSAGGVDANKALFFESPKGYTIPVAAGLLDSRRRYFIATETDRENFYDQFAQRVEKAIAPRLIKEGPCQENVINSDKVNLFDLPIPIWNELDGGPFITQGTTIVKDPETGQRNVGLYRLMVHNKNSTGICAAQYRQVVHFANEVHSQGQPLPVAVTIGQDPAITAAAIVPFPPYCDELSMAGAIRGEAVEMVKCVTIPLEVPATAEIVLEGEIRPGDTKLEGPFGEFTGYYGESMVRPVITIKAITHRNDPIYQACYQGRPPNCDSVTQILAHEAEVLRRVMPMGLKKLRICVGSAMFLAVASVKVEFSGQQRAIASAILGTPTGKWIKSIILIDDDLDPDDWTDVEWALGTRFRPGEDVMILEGMPGNALDPSLPPEERDSLACRTPKLVLDATKPVHRPYAPECRPKREAWDKVEADWESYGIPLK